MFEELELDEFDDVMQAFQRVEEAGGDEHSIDPKDMTILMLAKRLCAERKEPPRFGYY